MNREEVKMNINVLKLLGFVSGCYGIYVQIQHAFVVRCTVKQ